MADKTIDQLPQELSPVGGDFLVASIQSAGPATRKIAISDLPSATPTIPTGLTVWVDAANGNDGTGASGRQDLPFATVGAALAAATSGDLVRVRPGTYAESGLSIPAGVVVSGDSWQTTTIGSAAAAADIIAIGSGSGLQHVTVQVPTAAHAGITHIAGTGSLVGVNLAGDGATGAGDGVYKSGAGKLIGGTVRCEAGGLNSVLRCSAGVLALDDVHVPQSAGTTGSVLLCEGTGRYQGQGLNAGSTNVTDVITLAATATAILYSPNIFNAANAVHITADGVSLTMIGGQVDAALRTVWVDPALTGTGTTVRALSTVLVPLFDFPAAAAGNTDFVLSFNQAESLTRDSRQRIIGADLALGFPELGSGLEVGRGAPYSDGITVYTTDGTETMVGATVTAGNQTDVTTAAQSRTSSTFSFQGLTAGHAIYLASTRATPAGVELRHWGLLLDQVVAGVGGSYVVEIWDGAAWVSVGVMATSEADSSIYGADVFLRAGQAENVHLGIDSSTTQALTTVGGIAAYHTRIRVLTTLTTAPTWERVRLMESSSAANGLGQLTARGLAQWRAQIFGVGNVWAEVAGAADAQIAVGTGGQPTGWNHKIKKGLLNGNGDAASWQAQIPPGLNTAHPLYFTLTYSIIGSPSTVAPDLILSLLRLRTQGVIVADPAGGIVPIARVIADAEAYNSKAAETQLLNPPVGTVNNLPLQLTFGPFDIADYYPGDSLVLAIEMDAGGTPAQDVALWSLTVEGVAFSAGLPL